MVAAWISALTGVGPAMASGSQTKSGICADLPVEQSDKADGFRTQQSDMLLELHEVQSPDALAPQFGDEKQNPEHKAEITDAVDDESFITRDRIGVILIPKADEQIGTETHALPADEKHQKIVSHHQQEHEKDKQIQIDEKANHPLIVAHVTERIDMDQKADAGDDQQHHGGQGINL
jgi:hypothetical protein